MQQFTKELDYIINYQKLDDDINLTFKEFVARPFRIQLEISRINAGRDVNIIVQHFFNSSYQYQSLIEELNSAVKHYNQISKDDTDQIESQNNLILKLNEKITKFRIEILTTAESITKLNNSTEKHNKASDLFFAGKIDEAKKVLNETKLDLEQEEIFKENEFISNKLRANSDNFVTRARLVLLDLNNENRIIDAERCFKKALKSYETLNALMQYAAFLISERRFEESIDYHKKALLQNINIREHTLILFKLAKTYTAIFDNASSIYYSLQAIKLIENTHQLVSFEEELTLSYLYMDIGLIEKHKKNKIKAYPKFKKALDIQEKYLTLEPDYVKPSIANTYLYLAQTTDIKRNNELNSYYYEKAKNSYIQLIAEYKIFENKFKEISSELLLLNKITVLSNLSECYLMLGEFEHGKEVIDQALKFIHQSFEEYIIKENNLPELKFFFIGLYCRLYMNLGYYYLIMHNIYQVDWCLTKSMEIGDKQLTEDSYGIVLYVTLLAEIRSMYLDFTNSFSKANAVQKKAKILIENIQLPIPSKKNTFYFELYTLIGENKKASKYFYGSIKENKDLQNSNAKKWYLLAFYYTINYVPRIFKFLSNFLIFIVLLTFKIVWYVVILFIRSCILVLKAF